MNVRLDDPAGHLPWEFSVTIAGKSYAMRPMTFADFAEIQRTATAPMDAGGLRVALLAMFEDPKPDLDPVRLEAVLVLVYELAGYWKRQQAARKRPARMFN